MSGARVSIEGAAAFQISSTWMGGPPLGQSPARAATPKVGWDSSHELWKAAPLADWDDERCWGYIRDRDLPYNELHDRGYASIGCTHCTLPGGGRDDRMSWWPNRTCSRSAGLTS